MNRPRLPLLAFGTLALFAGGGCRSNFEFSLPEGHPALSDSSIGSLPRSASPYETDIRSTNDLPTEGERSSEGEKPSFDAYGFEWGSDELSAPLAQQKIGTP